MPQMSPLLWFNLYIYFIFLFIFIMSIIYFNIKKKFKKYYYFNDKYLSWEYKWY